jgi:cold shock CspA family protein/uncharacterized LabA/DUF88 family protein
MPAAENKLTRIGVFYDGNFFWHVSNYYAYNHLKHSRISIPGLHTFIRHKVAENESSDVRYCQIVDAHYFRGRVRAQDAENKLLLSERIFDEVLMREGITTHYLPLGPDGEKGIDVWLALEAYELSIYKHFDVTVLVACDGDFLPLVRKLNTLGTRVMLLGWDFKYTDRNGRERETKTAQFLLDEATYPLMMHQIIDDRSMRNDPIINGLFIPPKEFSLRNVAVEPVSVAHPAEVQQQGKIQSLKQGYGFITPTNGGINLFFYHGEILNADFSELAIGDSVEYDVDQNEKGPCAIRVRVLAHEMQDA